MKEIYQNEFNPGQSILAILGVPDQLVADPDDEPLNISRCNVRSRCCAAVDYGVPPGDPRERREPVRSVGTGHE